MKRQDKLMALLSIWGMLLVILGHSGMAEPEIEPHVMWLKNWIYSFHMPLFFFISGYLYSVTNPNFLLIDKISFLKKKAQRLLIPYFVYGVFSLSINGLLLHESLILNATAFIRPHELGYLWFIITLFFCFFVLQVLAVCHVDVKLTWQALCLCIVLLCFNFIFPTVPWLNFSELMWYMVFFVVGVQFHVHQLVRLLNSGCYFFPLFLLVVISSLILSNYTIEASPLMEVCGKIVVALLGIYTSLAICKTLLQIDFISRKVIPYAACTYMAYLIHKFFQIPARKIALDVLQFHWAISLLIIFAAGVIPPLILYELRQRYGKGVKCKVIDFIIGC